MLVWAVMFASVSYGADVATLLLEQVKKSNLLLAGNVVDIVSTQGRRYVISAGVASIGAQTPQAKLSAMRISKLRAREAMTKFIYGSKVLVDERMETKTTIMTNASGRNRQVDEALIVTLREIGKGGLPPLIEVGNWLTDDGRYFWVIGIACP